MAVLKGVFLGTGTSQGIPVIGCDCSVCKSQNLYNKRLRTSFFLSYKDVDIVIDAGPDFRQQMLQNNITNVDAILLTHEHKDHTGGLDDIRPINFRKKQAMDIYAEDRVIESVRREYSYVFKKKTYPGVPLMVLHEISNMSFQFNSLTIQPIRTYHWDLPVFGFRIDSFAYITDASLIEDSEMRKLHNLDVLVINALRFEKHYSHFNLEEALHIIEILKPKHAYLTHISHYLGDHTETQKKLPPHVSLAYDGLQIQI
ncbi:MAG: MBL fold metallo-hydrolase [Bacteroidales bacterium]|jgi:phosphoribosyl 1,2-cyclic phosphate phosphodiesterase|nr:MBL fold metallo-hydrolase [Bacteroidales bacterium]